MSAFPPLNGIWSQTQKFEKKKRKEEISFKINQKHMYLVHCKTTGTFWYQMDGKIVKTVFSLGFLDGD